MRKIPTQVPAAVSRLLQSTTLQTPPVWFAPVLSHPPPILPARQTPNRSPLANDLPQSILRAKDSKSHKMNHLKEPKPRPKDIVYQEDRIRRQFFKDFPFEALRPVSLVEGTFIGSGVGEKEGAEWTSLEQRGAYPTVEDCIQFTLSLHRHHALPLTQAYTISTKEFIKLRGAHELATQAAEAEARAHGAIFTSDPWARTMAKERSNLDSLAPSTSTSATSATRVKYRKAPRYAWSTTVPASSLPTGEFTGGQGYIRGWSLPPPVESQTKPAGDLTAAAIGPGEEVSSGQPALEEMGEQEQARVESIQHTTIQP